MRITFVVVAFIGLVMSMPAFSQQVNLAGRWQCEFAVRETVIRENNLPSVYVKFEILLYPNGTFQSQGVTNEQFPFQAQGQWALDANYAFVAQGQQQDHLGISQYYFSSDVKAQNIMNSNDIGPSGKQVLSSCQKIG